MKIHQLKSHCLGLYEVVIGNLTELKRNEDSLVAQVGEVDIELPFEMEKTLRLLLGTRVVILHTDIPGKEYLVRSIPQDEQAIQGIALKNRKAATATEPIGVV